MNKPDFNFMKTYISIVANFVMVAALLLSPFAVDTQTITTNSYQDSGFQESVYDHESDGFLAVAHGFSIPTPDIPSLPDYSDIPQNTCEITASSHLVPYNGSVTLDWSVTGFTDVKINGDSVSGSSGTYEVDGLTEETTFVLEATDNNGSNCTQTVVVDCEPPEEPKFCELDVRKSVNQSQAEIGDVITYSIVVENVGEADCSDGGVRIEDQVDENLEYLNHTISSNASGGYGNLPVFNQSDQTLYFDGGTLNPGEEVNITWIGEIQTPNQCGDFEVTNQAKAISGELNNYVTSSVVRTNVDYDCVSPQPECELSPASQSIDYGARANLSWTTNNADQVTITEFGSVSNDGSRQTQALFTDKTYTLTATGPGGEVSCVAEVEVGEQDTPTPTCDLFTANPSNIMVGGSSSLNWESTNAVQAFINNGIGEVDVDGSVNVSPLDDTTYVLTLIGAEDLTVDCSVPVEVSEDPVPVCESFTANPNSLPAGGGNVELDWTVTDATNVSISPTIGSVNLTGTETVNVEQSTTFVLTATDDDGDEASCTAPVTVADQEAPLTCSDNVNFSVSDSSIRRGESTELTWSTVDVDSVSISGINSSQLSGSETVSPSNDTTYTLTATRDDESVNCPVSVDVSTGGGGGGSPTPRCELEISDSKIRQGEEIRLTWETSNATELTLTDDEGEVILTTDDYLASDKEEFFDDSIRLKPTRDTEYTLLVERGSRDRECKVDVEIENPVTVLESRDQQPLVSGISLNQVPYTGFEAGPFMTIMFYALLVAWSLYVTYLIVLKRQTASAVNNQLIDVPETNDSEEYYQSYQDFSQSDQVVKSQTQEPVSNNVIPQNLPTGSPVIGYQSLEENKSDEQYTELENRAHEQRALLSSDAVKRFVETVDGSLDRNEALDKVIIEAKNNYPLEDGWVVINESRMINLCDTCKFDEVSTATHKESADTNITGAGSLAEAIVTGNVISAYEMIGHKPMFSLAEAAADLDALYRRRKGEAVSVSELLVNETRNISDQKLAEIITSLTSAIDGTYSDEASAVKMAIMKAVKATN